MAMTRKAATLALSALISTVFFSQATAEGTRHETRFSVKFGGLTVGSMTFGVDLDGKNYKLTGNGKTEGLAEWFAAGKAKIISQGALSGNKLSASDHYFSVTEKDKTSTLEMGFSGGEVTRVAVKPDKRKKKSAEKYVLIQPSDLKDVMDPASTLVVPVDIEKANDPHAVCDRTLRIYDGDARYDMALSYKTNRKMETGGYNGWAYVCKMKYVPVAGYKRGHKNTARMAANEDMEIWLAPIGQSGVFTPIRIYVPTWIGTFSAEPEYFGPAKG